MGIEAKHKPSKNELSKSDLTLTLKAVLQELRAVENSEQYWRAKAAENSDTKTPRELAESRERQQELETKLEAMQIKLEAAKKEITVIMGDGENKAVKAWQEVIIEAAREVNEQLNQELVLSKAKLLELQEQQENLTHEAKQ